eukprot:6663138-Alexandrium_andersonii.AAC.1
MAAELSQATSGDFKQSHANPRVRSCRSPHPPPRAVHCQEGHHLTDPLQQCVQHGAQDSSGELRRGAGRAGEIELVPETKLEISEQIGALPKRLRARKSAGELWSNRQTFETPFESWGISGDLGRALKNSAG